MAALRLLFVVNDAGFFLSHRLPLARAARDWGADVHVATGNGPDVEKIVEIGFPFHRLPMHRRSVGVRTELRSIAALISLYRRLTPDIVHHVTIKPVLYGSVAARLTGVPAVVNAVTGLGYVYSSPDLRAVLMRGVVRPIYRVAFRHPRSVAIFQNPDDLALFSRNGVVNSAAAVVIRGSGVDVEQFAFRPEPVGTPTVVFSARMLWPKGVGEFVQAARTLRDAGVSARFLLVGDTDSGNPAAVPREQLEAWAASGEVVWCGHQDDMPQVLAGSHIVCLPSTYAEGVPKALIEAAAVGRAIVTTNTPGCREIVQHGHNGLLVPPGDPVALASAIAELIADPEKRQAMGARGRELVVAEFSTEKVIAETMEVYCQLLSSEPRLRRSGGNSSEAFRMPY